MASPAVVTVMIIVLTRRREVKICLSSQSWYLAVF